ncbi:conserved hypothetical protein [Deferribacter desulfuricans SSM1]|uniref:Flavin reductase like domain-containing protein n=1 Tax=Deferribacter desulfuricans (strain DSM 14783 / JCM 11476 / NBRC 101012 / SSM1) TaxID=639282 RepID=D3PE76_DEFDS|nr:flavin reductase [Deferribacter desulfuricans]BAI80899.1 conserved hypothetical protein [Deferribacter desulfuricans SSM1]
MFKKVNIKEVNFNPFTEINDRWMLITPTVEKVNPMTASWGGFGILWHKNVVYTFIRPTRYTFELMEKTEYFTLSFFDEEYRDVLNYCGTKSGHDIDKVKETGLSVVKDDNFIYFEEAEAVYCCKKLCFADLNPSNFLEDEIETFYPKKDYHRMYIGEIVHLIKKIV